MGERRSALIFSEQVKLIYKLMPVGLIATAINGSVLAILLIDVVPGILILIWITLLLTVTVLRTILMCIAIDAISKQQKVDMWANMFITGILIAGIIWGSAAYFGLLHASDAHRVLVAFVIGGMAAGASATFSAIRLAYFAFTIPALLSQIVVFFIIDDIIYFAMAGMMIFFGVLVSVTALTNYHNIIISLRLRFEKEDLITSLMSAEKLTSLKNVELEKEISHREKVENELLMTYTLLEEKVNLRTAELQLANEKLENSNRELSNFTHSVSHDLRAPLFSIDNFGTILEEECGGTLNESAKEALFYIRKSTNRMKDLVRDLLLLSCVTRSELSIKEVNLSIIAADISETLRMRNPKRNINFIIQPDVKAECDQRIVRIALENLLDNAWKYTSKNENACIEFGVKEKKRVTFYFVADNGIGFDMKFVNKIFSPFQRLHRESDFPGTGIGLATVKRIIQRHGGVIWVESIPGKGSTFFFTLKSEVSKNHSCPN